MKAAKSCLLAITISLTVAGALAPHGVVATARLRAMPQRPRPWDKVKEVSIGSLAPDWRLKTAAGDTLTLSELRGKVVVLDFWANWCGPCRKLEPLLERLAHEYQSRPVVFFTMSIWPDRDFNPNAFLKERKTSSVFLIGDDAVAREYGIWGIPTYYVIDVMGRVSYIDVLLSVNEEALGRRLRDAIDQALPRDQSQTSAPRRPQRLEETDQPPGTRRTLRSPVK